MNVADVLCLTSRSEGMPNVVVEALASGLPVVATAVGACPELLANEPSARLCRSGDVDALAGALREVLDMTVDRQALAARHSKHYSWEGQAKTLLNVMEIETPDPNALPRGAGIE
jgi:glycosyltransferase involved in cell wall biosynthesis